MSPDLQELEAKLSALRPAVLDSGLLARLAESATGDPASLSPELAAFEASLRHRRPAPLPAALAAALTQALPPANVIPFQGTKQPVTHRHWNRPMLAAAAAVAILGASAALFMPGHDSPPSAVATHTPTAPAAPSATPGHTRAPVAPSANFVPADFNTGFSQASDEGVVWQDANQPRRVVKVVYWDRVTLVNPDGRKVEVEQPRIEYILVPEKID